MPISRQHVVWRPDSDDYRPERGSASTPPCTSSTSFQRNPVLATNPPADSNSAVAGTDTSQGKGQIISNINACLAVQATIKSTLGPYGGDLLMVDANGRQTITNDGATVMKVRSAKKDSIHERPRPFLTLVQAPRHRPPRRPDSRGHCALARCGSG